MTIRAHQLMPMFTATAADGRPVRYEDIWQHQNLLLVSLAADDPTSEPYAASLTALQREFTASEAVLLVTRTPVPGIASPSVVVADRWGEVYYVKEAARAADLPPADELLEWLQFVRNECPECQGETR